MKNSASSLSTSITLGCRKLSFGQARISSPFESSRIITRKMYPSMSLVQRSSTAEVYVYYCSQLGLGRLWFWFEKLFWVMLDTLWARLPRRLWLDFFMGILQSAMWLMSSVWQSPLAVLLILFLFNPSTNSLLPPQRVSLGFLKLNTLLGTVISPLECDLLLLIMEFTGRGIRLLGCGSISVVFLSNMRLRLLRLRRIWFTKLSPWPLSAVRVMSQVETLRRLILKLSQEDFFSSESDIYVRSFCDYLVCDRDCNGQGYWVVGGIDNINMLNNMLRRSPYFQANKAKFYEEDQLKVKESTLPINKGIQLEKRKEEFIRNLCYCCQKLEVFQKCEYCSKLACQKCIQKCENCSKQICTIDLLTDYNTNLMVCPSCIT